METSGVIYVHGPKCGDFDAGDCGPLGCCPGIRVHYACSLPPLLPRNDGWLRFGDDERCSPVLPDALFRNGRTSEPRDSARAPDWRRTVVRFRTSDRSR
jgi:hypothetical protein